MSFVDFIDRVRQLTTTPVLSSMDNTTALGNQV